VDQQEPGAAGDGAEVAAFRGVERPAVDLRLEVPAASAHVAEVRRAVRDAARAHGITEPLLGDIGLAITEACANAVIHAYRDAPGPGLLTVEVYRQHGDFVVTVSDAGTGIAPRADGAGLGLGLALIAHMTRRMEIARNEPRGSTVLMAFAIS
jgi:anti-sigma regulatory factor (Ser/Thr protein kinase)